VKELAVRPYATVGIALVGASVIAISPVAPPPPGVEISRQVRLSAAVDPITPWRNVIGEADANLSDLAAAWREDPAPVLRQVIANQIGYLSELPNFPAILQQISANLDAAFAAPFATDLSTLDGGHAFAFPIVTDGLPDLGIPPLLPAELQPLLNLTTTYLSGVALGLVGPVVGPGLALGASTQAIIGSLTGDDPDPEAALNDLINIPAGMTDAFLNGGESLDLTPILAALGPVLGVELPEGTKIGVALGGVLSPGGSAFNALDITIEVLGVPLTISGQGPGAIGSLIGLSKVIGAAITPDDAASSATRPLGASATLPSGSDDPAQVPTSILHPRLSTLAAPESKTVSPKSDQVAKKVDPARDAINDISGQAADARAQVDKTVKRATERTNAVVTHMRDQIEKSVRRATHQLNDISQNARDQMTKTVAGDEHKPSTDTDKTGSSQQPDTK
jgi:hypothetical protein